MNRRAFMPPKMVATMAHVAGRCAPAFTGSARPGRGRVICADVCAYGFCEILVDAGGTIWRYERRCGGEGAANLRIYPRPADASAEGAVKNVREVVRNRHRRAAAKIDAPFFDHKEVRWWRAMHRHRFRVA
ncbi:MAG: hypothetical protein WA215_08385 [Candidatus Cybelea sp.]